MATIVTRAGKGAPLTHTEVDANFTNLNTDKLESGSTASSLTITSADINGGTIDGTVIGGSTPAAISGTTGVFGVTSLSASNNYGTPALGTGSANSFSAFHIEAHDNNPINGPYLGFVRSQGTQASPTNLVSGDYIGVLTGQAFQTAGSFPYRSCAEVRFTADGAHSSTSLPSRIDFFTTASGSAVVTERMRIDSSGRVGIGTSSPSQGIHLKTASGNSYVKAERTTSSQGEVGFNTDNWYMYQKTGGTDLHFYNTADRMTINSSGNVGIGTSSPAAKLQIDNAAASHALLNVHQLNTSYNTDISLYNQNNTTSTTLISKRTDGDLWLYQSGANNIVAHTSGTERMRIDSSGNVGIGTSSPIFPLHVVGVFGADYFRPTSNQTDPNDGAAYIYQQSGVGWDFASLNLKFSTGGSGARAERMRINSAGDVNIGTANTGLRYLDVINTGSTSTDGSIIRFITQQVGSTATTSAEIYKRKNGEFRIANFETNAAAYMAFNVGASERMRIDSSGALLINRTANASTFHYSAISYNANAGHRGLAIQATVQDIGTAITFYNASGTVCGSISQGTSSTSYNTSSDYRLKENVVPLAGAADRLAQIPVHRFNFIADPDRTVDGFLAHEMQAFVPEAVTGQKDEVDADGNPVYQGIDQSKLVPLLTAALQEALTKIEALEARITALEAQP